MRDAKLPARAVACEVEGESLWGPKEVQGGTVVSKYILKRFRGPEFKTSALLLLLN